MFKIHRHVFLMAEGGGGAGAPGGEAELVEVDLGGVKQKLTKTEADKVIAWRDGLKKTAREAEEKAGRSVAEKTAAEEAKAKAERDAQAMEAAKRGELEKTRELLTKEHADKLARLGANLRDKALAAAVRAAPKVAPTAVDDIIDQLRSRSRYDEAADAVVVLDAAGQPLKDDSGKPVQVDAWLPAWLEKRPHYLLDGTPAGSGAEGGAKGDGAKRRLTRQDYEKAREAGDSVTLTAVSKGQILLVD